MSGAGTILVVQWLRLFVSNARGTGLILGRACHALGPKKRTSGGARGKDVQCMEYKMLGMYLPT